MCLSPLRTRADYDRAFGVVRQVIHTWDPYGLISGGAPLDEWDGEVASLVAEVPRISSADDAVSAVSCIFTAAFQAEGFGLSDCAEVGQQLYSAVKAAGLLSAGT